MGKTGCTTPENAKKTLSDLQKEGKIVRFKKDWKKYDKNWNRIKQKWENCVQTKEILKQNYVCSQIRKRKICPILTTLGKKQCPIAKKVTKNRQMSTKLRENLTKYRTFGTKASYASSPLHTRPRTGGVPSQDHSLCPPVVYDCDNSKLIIQ